MDNKFDFFLDKLKNAAVTKNNDSDHTGIGTPVFVKQDVINAKNILSKLMRAIFIKERITIQELGHKQRDYLVNKKEIDPTKVSTAKTNLIAALARPAVSFNKFYETVVDILGFDLDITITLSRDGVERIYNYKKIISEISVSKDDNTPSYIQQMIVDDGQKEQEDIVL